MLENLNANFQHLYFLHLHLTVQKAVTFHDQPVSICQQKVYENQLKENHGETDILSSSSEHI